ncbi:spermidine Synthase isoform X1 [Haemaphysalis longicornis]
MVTTARPMKAATKYSLAGMNVLKEGWFTEIVNTNNNPVLSVDVEEVLHQERSNYQDILVFKSKSFGTVLALDNAIQCTERDEFSYQEMITFLPLNCHPDPKDVLIIGGGDGGVAREVVKHPSVVSVTQCEIDEKVVEVSKKYLPFMAEGFNSPKLELKIGDGFQFIKETNRKFDVVITDSSDPIGPAVALFQKPYYEGLKRILKPGGIVCSQGESMWFDLKLIAEMMDMCRTLFPVVNYASIYTPTYPSGQIGFLLCSTLPDTDFRNPVHKFSEEQLRSMKVRYYSPEVHQAALALPRFVKQTLYK